MKRQRNILNFLPKIPRTESSVEEATEIATDDIHPSFMNNADATSASDMSTVNTVSPVDQIDVTLHHCITWRSDRCSSISARLLEYNAIREFSKKIRWIDCS